MTGPRIPDHLLTYHPDRWMPHVETSVHLRHLRARELWRQAQDTWGDAHGVDRSAFEALQAEQRAEQGDAGVPEAAVNS